MRKKLLLIFLILAFCVCSIGVTSMLAMAESSENTAIAKVQGDTNGFVSEDEWASQTEYSFTGDTEIGVKFAIVGQNLFFRMTANDSTKFSNKDRLAYKITVGGTVMVDLQGNFDPWLVGTQPTTLVQIEVNSTSNSDNSVPYIFTYGFALGDKCVDKASVLVEFTYNDAKNGDTAWGAGDTNTLTKTLSIDLYPAPVNENLNVVITDIAGLPKESDWQKATAYNLIANNSRFTDGATGTIKILSCAGNLYFRLEVNDPTTHKNKDGVYIYLGNETKHIETRGNYDKWLALKENTFTATTPSLMEQKSTAEDVTGYTLGTYTFDYGMYIPELYGENNTLRLCVRHRDSRSAAEGWADADQAHTIYFDQIVTFGAPADTTIRPQTATSGFTGSADNISYNKANVNWSNLEGAETYKIFVYKVNAEGSQEPYEHLSTEGPVYAEGNTFSESISGLNATTKYAVQIVAIDSTNNEIGYSSLITFETISRDEALTPSDDGKTEQPDDTKKDDAKTDTEEKRGCNSSVSELGIFGLVLICCAVILKKRTTKLNK